MFTSSHQLTIATILLLAAQPTYAQIVEGGSSYIQSFSAETALLEAALPLHPGFNFKLTRVWTKLQGDGRNTGDFFANCGGIGPTVLIAEVEAPFGHPNILPGAYNGQSWDPTLRAVRPPAQFSRAIHFFSGSTQRAARYRADSLRTPTVWAQKSAPRRSDSALSPSNSRLRSLKGRELLAPR